jgi:ADP-ribose pyrophosphatase YjhB (NUDIX family)
MNDKICTLLFLRRGDEILLAMKKRGFGADRWNGVGGKIELNENEEQALIRETQEEIEVTPTKFQKVAVHDFALNTNGEIWHMYVHTYLGTEWTGEPAETEEMAPKWFKITEIPYDQMWEDDTFWLPQVLAGNKVKGTFLFDADDKLVSHDVQIVETL